ncbi:FAD-linked oxidoreductase-like protein [Syncephalastrum racemosum]|uniref:Proline dehydrogenase n=1 Tax=Syncephalastrum racemosum TaxID=13706 RepID=A0A1X2H5F6_SYNRA|nr:FAD-linked oxidoreductase-like protein [Syncephalastrum racemosum]
MAEAPLLQAASSELRNGATPTIAELQDDEGRVAMRAKSTEELVLAMFVYGLCMVPGLVSITPPIIQTAEALHLQAPLYWIIKRTVFRHFCGGETPDECVASMDRLAESGINCILDLSIEADLHIDDKKAEDQSYFPLQENRADIVLDMTKECLRTAAAASSSGAFVAVKVTAFAPPELLLRLNTVLLQLEQGFDAWQRGDGTIDSEGLRQMAEHVLPPPKSIEQQIRREALLVQVMTPLDQIQTAQFFDPQGPHRDIWWETHEEQAEMTPLTPEELAAYDRMVERLERVCDFAHNNHVGIMVDAEQSYFQEAIDHVAVNLQAKYNRRDDRAHTPTVYNTYQMYTKAAQRKLERDVERARRQNFAFAAKLVRGAYMVMERKRAAQLGYPSPIHDTLTDTHASFDGGVKYLLDELREFYDATGEPISDTTSPIVFMVASHNRNSIIQTVREMEKHKISPRAGVVHFGQLFGMQDQISYTLGKYNYSIYKYLPYGKIEEVMPYLLRRAQENSSIMGGVGKEITLMWSEVKERLFGPKQKPKLVTITPQVDGTPGDVDVEVTSTSADTA